MADDDALFAAFMGEITSVAGTDTPREETSIKDVTLPRDGEAQAVSTTVAPDVDTSKRKAASEVRYAVHYDALQH